MFIFTMFLCVCVCVCVCVVCVENDGLYPRLDSGLNLHCKLLLITEKKSVTVLD